MSKPLSDLRDENPRDGVDRQPMFVQTPFLGGTVTLPPGRYMASARQVDPNNMTGFTALDQTGVTTTFAAANAVFMWTNGGAAGTPGACTFTPTSGGGGIAGFKVMGINAGSSMIPTPPQVFPGLPLNA